MRAAVLAMLLLALGAGSAEAAYKNFQTPSGNIGCGWITGSNEVRCDILQSSDMPRKPASCEFDYGHAYFVRGSGRARTLCAGDTVVDRRAPVLAYGKKRRIGNITCRSKTSGLRCKNKSGHGFFLSREDIRKF
jgi:hypothetical protein